MNVDWWLVGLSFAVGLVLTMALLFGGPGSAADPEGETPTVKITAAQRSPTSSPDMPTTRIRADAPTVRIASRRFRWRLRRR